MSTPRTLCGLLLLTLCGTVLADEPTPMESCLQLAMTLLAENPQLQERWQQTWVEPSSIHEEVYDGAVEGQHASKRLTAQLRRGDQSDGQFICLLAENGKALSVDHLDDADTP
ncbi:hypothetical protein N5J43_03450 [Pseudomonas nicosulfuronedens]|uniref:Ig-like domain-containing protein n=1 Tax=Pseudomonas nicosulfuronedens TaxID=2571105 RepID=A0A5R9RD60_9PSED|nr:hypothetical protein [Pseudomonas nicosulfuronedens]MDH1009080.1 hypothetical protein [Pseudomonas nicosulfuronedens]MDH1977993.1 hypothetical protein [Pseudomonas nicosulfuronedens]MDH2027128.1 hypothetical protein [Pseudomonas nicosulfuronedens]TLX80986.1 hypothetical protein FAS41_00390 [Pseudomonas nicosulfuronedens]